MAATTPRRSARVPHMHTPKMSERKKGLFQSGSEASRESLTKHRQLTVLDSESESDDCDLGIMGTLDSSSCDENDHSVPKTPERTVWHTTRSQSRKLLKENQDLKNFIKSPFTLKKYQTRYSCPDSKCTGSLSTPATPHFQHHPGTPSSTHSCASVHTTSSTSSRARKSLASLIADTESCSSSLKDLNFDTDSGTDSKENTPSKFFRRSTRRQKMTPKLNSFKGVLLEQKKNLSPLKTAVVCLTKMDMSTILSPTQMQKTPHNISESNISPPKLGHNRRLIVQIDESPESTCDSEKSHKRLHYDSKSDVGPNSKYARLETSAPKARISLFNSDRLKEMLSAKSFYGKSNPELNTNISTTISRAIEVTKSHRRRLFSSYSQRSKRKPGQINLGVRHKIRKPKVDKHKIMHMKSNSSNNSANVSKLNSTASSSANDSLRNQNDTSISHNTSQDLDKTDPFNKEKQTIEALLSQWTEEEIPESELNFTQSKPGLACFNTTIIEETSQIFQPVTAVPVSTVQTMPQDSEKVFVELGMQRVEEDMLQLPVNAILPKVGETSQQNAPADVVMVEAEHITNHGDMPKSGQFLPVEGGYIFVDENAVAGQEVAVQEDLPDLDEIERELKMLDEQILKMAQCNNIDPQAVLASTETSQVTIAVSELSSTSAGVPESGSEDSIKDDNLQKMFSIFSKPNPGTPTTPKSKGTLENVNKKTLLRREKNGSNQYVIDAGQKKFGATQCKECGVIYQIGDPQDEHDHLVHHHASDVLKFNGLKEEYVVGRAGSARCLRVRGGEAGWRKVETLLARVVHPYLGFDTGLPKPVHNYTAYLYIDKKQIVGCLVVEPKLKAYKLLPGDPDCCSVEEYPVKCGVCRIWTHSSYRRRGLGSRLLDCARASMLLGSGLGVNDLAFSAPTASGKALAAAYCGTPHFYVYLD